MDETGDLVLLDVSGDTPYKIGSARTSPDLDGYAEILSDGRLVVWKSGNADDFTILWESNTLGGVDVSLGVYVHSDEFRQSYAHLDDSWFREVWWTGGYGHAYGGGPCINSYVVGLYAGDGFTGRKQYECYDENLIFGLDEEGDLVLLDVSGDKPYKILVCRDREQRITDLAFSVHLASQMVAFYSTSSICAIQTTLSLEWT